MEQFLIAALRAVVLVHLTLLLAHSILEWRFAHRHTSPRTERAWPASWPAVDVVVPTYNEDPAVLEACWRSLAALDYPGQLQVWLVDDGSMNRDALRPVYQRFRQQFPGAAGEVVFLPGNVGKRKAQDAGFRRGDGELVVLMDSDTVVERSAIRRAAVAFADGRVGAVSGRLGVLNASMNLLTRLLEDRYRLRFEVERPAQGFFGSLLCCAGPFTMFRRGALDPVWERYQGQTFVGVPCINGDDLHLTNLLLSEGHRLLFDPVAFAFTGVPSSLGQYLRQQLRWSRSLYRELGWTFAAVRRRHPYLVLDVLARAVLPLLLGTALLLLGAEGVVAGKALLLNDVSLVVALMVASALFVLGHGGTAPFLLLYGPLHIALLIPVRVYALATLASPRWETRQEPRSGGWRRP
jgi:N-acetylglucosaminyltransferase